MPTVKLRKVSKKSYSLVFTCPVKIVRRLILEKGDRFDVKTRGNEEVVYKKIGGKKGD